MISIRLTDKDRDFAESVAYFDEADAWAQKHCKSYKGYTTTDVSDVSYTIDTISSYEFTDEKDANWFELKWR